MTVERFPVEAGHILVFARAIGDTGAVHEAEAAAGERRAVIAPPTFVEASAQFDPDYPLRPAVGRPWFGSTRRPTEAPEPPLPASPGAGEPWAALHAEQHYRYHRPVRSGDVLHASSRAGARWERQGRRGGLLRFAETITEYRDDTGNLVVTARSVEVSTERAVSD